MPTTVCPNCSSAMTEVARRGVYVDVCTRCRGVWLDGGELEKLLAVAERDAPESPDTRRYASADEYRRSHSDDGWSRSEKTPQKKKGGVFDMLGDLFE